MRIWTSSAAANIALALCRLTEYNPAAARNQLWFQLDVINLAIE
ncbi:MAG: hypothetical protein JWQ30_1503 [Sediminibacterium sp.]|nr:hypothetical protein [Sediminibacterium sp.]